jgi:hypothetical protein
MAAAPPPTASPPAASMSPLLIFWLQITAAAYGLNKSVKLS